MHIGNVMKHINHVPVCYKHYPEYIIVHAIDIKIGSRIKILAVSLLECIQVL